MLINAGVRTKKFFQVFSRPFHGTTIMADVIFFRTLHKLLPETHFFFFFFFVRKIHFILVSAKHASVSKVEISRKEASRIFPFTFSKIFKLLRKGVTIFSASLLLMFIVPNRGTVVQERILRTRNIQLPKEL